MTTRLLLIDTPGAFRDQVCAWLREAAPELEPQVREPALGCPNGDFGWHDYGLLLLGYQLGLDQTNGLEWLRALRADARVPPIIVLTAHGSEATAVRAIKLGAQDYLSKHELTPERLVEAVRDALGGHAGSEPDPMAATVPLALEDQSPLVRSTAQAAAKMPARRFYDTGHGVTRQPPEVTVPGYSVERHVGAGGMASVYLARRDEDARRVALKVLPLNDQWEPGLLRRFIREYNLLGQLEHPNVVRTYERAFARDFAYIAMEYFEGGDLAARVASDLSPDVAVDWLRQIAAGLGAAHDIGILHRDIKPSNVLFRSDGVPAIVDFGISKMRDDISTLSFSPMSPSVLGTPYYISPEQIQDRAADERSDLYSLGVILYELLTGTRPFRGTSLPELFQAHISAPVPRLPPGLGRLQPVVDGLLAKDPDERFQSTEELLLGIDWEA